MIFKPEMVERILAGKKTVTRRPVKYVRYERIQPFGGFTEPVEVARACRYEVGKDYAVQPGRGEKAVGRIRIKDVRRGLLAGVDANDARLEGFQTAGEFRRYWADLYGTCNQAQQVDRIEFELVPAEQKGGGS